MTGNNTSPGEKLRAVFLAVLMVGSVFAMGVAFSGSAAAAASNLTGVGNQDTVGDTFEASFDVNDNAQYTVEHTVDGEVVNTITVTDGGANDADGADDGNINVSLQAGLTPGGTSNVSVYDANDNLQVSADYTTTNYDVQVGPDEIIFGDTVTLEGDIYKYPGVKADDQTFNYSVYFNDNDANPGDQRVTDSDVNDGSFITTQTFDIEDDSYLKDYPADDGSGPAYEIYVREEGSPAPTPTTGNDGMDSVNIRLDMSAKTDVTPPIYKSSVDITGNLSDAMGNAIADYDVELKDPVAGTQKTTSTSGIGSYGFTAIMNDAGPWHMATNEGGVISYNPIEVAPQQADFSFTSDGQVVNFPTNYDITLKDNDTGDPLKLQEGSATNPNGYINVTGEFEGENTTGGPAAENLVSSNVYFVYDVADPDADGNVDHFKVWTNGSGQANFEATPLSDEVTAHLENREDEGADGAEVPNDIADTPNSPDYVGEETIVSAGTGPVNFVKKTITDDWTGSNILTDSGPSVIEVLPQPQDRGNYSQSVENGIRVGYDGNYALDGLRYYYFDFYIVDDENEPIRPTEGNLTKLEVTGLGANATIESDGDGTVSLTDSNGIVTDAGAEGWGNAWGQYGMNFRPQEANTEDAKVKVTAYVEGESPETWTIDATGLNISEFLIDGETVTEVQGRTTPDLSSVLNAPYDEGAPVNNGRVRLARTWPSQGAPMQLNETDARTANVNDGEYEFENVQVGPRGVDVDNDGIGEELAELTFTGYQYVDADNDQALNRDEVDRGALETLSIAPGKLNIIFDSSTSEYADHRTNAFGQPAFTLTKGMEYEQLAFHLEYDDGTPVDLTEGMDNSTVGLNDLAAMDFINLYGPHQEGGSGSAAQILFDEDASNSSEGYYVIDDISSTEWTDSDESASGPSWGKHLNEDGVFAFDEGNQSVDPTRGMDTYRLYIETADRSFASWQNESTGYIDVAEPKVDTEIISAYTGDDYANAGADDWHNLTDVTNVTTDINRWYGVNATLTDYFGTPINGSEFSETTVDDAFDWQGVDDDGNNVSFDSDHAEVNFHETLGNNLGGGDAAADELALNNESGMFQFDLKPIDADVNGHFDMEYDVSIQDLPDSDWNISTSGPPNAIFEDSPIGSRPLVEVYDQSGAMLPEEDGDKILANDVTQTLRIEAFPADEHDIHLPQRSFMIDTSEDPVGETTINTDTELQNKSVLVTDNDAPYKNIPYDQGQVGYLTVTPTGTGDKIISLRSDEAGNPVVLNTSGVPIEFDVLRSNKQAELNIGQGSVTPGSTVTATVLAASTEDPIGLAGVALSDTNGNVIATETTNQSGMVTIDVPASAELGDYSLETRPAGYQPVTQSFTVRSPAQLDEDLELFADEDQVISGTSSADAGTTYEIQVTAPGIVETVEATVQDDGTFSGTFNLSSLAEGDEVTAEISGVDSVSYTVSAAPTASISMRNQVSESGNVVTVDEVYLPEGGFVVIHNASTDEVVGSSAYLEPGTAEDVDVLMDETLAGGNNKVVAMAHQDTNDNEVLDFPDADGPYTADGSAVTDSASVAVPPEDGGDDTTTESTTETTEPEPDTTTEEDTGDGDGPGFGIAVAIFALLGAALLAVRRNE